MTNLVYGRAGYTSDHVRPVVLHSASTPPVPEPTEMGAVERMRLAQLCYRRSCASRSEKSTYRARFPSTTMRPRSVWANAYQVIFQPTAPTRRTTATLFSRARG